VQHLVQEQLEEGGLPAGVPAPALPTRAESSPNTLPPWPEPIPAPPRFREFLEPDDAASTSDDAGDESDPALRDIDLLEQVLSRRAADFEIDAGDEELLDDWHPALALQAVATSPSARRPHSAPGQRDGPRPRALGDMNGRRADRTTADARRPYSASRAAPVHRARSPYGVEKRPCGAEFERWEGEEDDEDLGIIEDEDGDEEFLAEEMNARRSAVTIFNRQGGATWYVSRNRQPRPLHGKRKPTTLSRAGNPFASARAVRRPHSAPSDPRGPVDMLDDRRGPARARRPSTGGRLRLERASGILSAPHYWAAMRGDRSLEEEEAGEEEAGRDWRDREDEDLGIINLGDEEWPEVLDAICEQSEVTIFNTSGRHGVRGTGTWYVASSSQGASGGAMAGPGKRRPLHGKRRVLTGAELDGSTRERTRPTKGVRLADATLEDEAMASLAWSRPHTAPVDARPDAWSQPIRGPTQRGARSSSPGDDRDDGQVARKGIAFRPPPRRMSS